MANMRLNQESISNVASSPNVLYDLLKCANVIRIFSQYIQDFAFYRREAYPSLLHDDLLSREYWLL